MGGPSVPLETAWSAVSFHWSTAFAFAPDSSTPVTLSTGARAEFDGAVIRSEHPASKTRAGSQPALAFKALFGITER
jgi:hypothetical protein